MLLGAIAAVVEDGRLLLVRRNEIDVWEMPGGLVEPGEAPWEAATRECLEEIGVDVVAEALSRVYHRRAKEIVVMVFRCRRVQGEPRPSKEAREVGWFGLDDLPDNMVEVARARAHDVFRQTELVFVTQEGKSNTDLRQELGLQSPDQPWWTWSGRTRAPTDTSVEVKEERIRTIAICVVRRDDAILVFDAHDPYRDLTYHRPLGGALLFGESSEEAVRRELLEEIGAELVDLELLGVIENRFELGGLPAHEIVFVYEGGFVDRSLYEQERFVVIEESETLAGGWMPMTAFDMTTRPLYPTGLLDLLTKDP